MSIVKRATLAAAFSGLTSLLMATAHAAPAGAEYGGQVADNEAIRTIVISPDPKYVNVANGETVQFNVNGKVFTWHFDTLRNEATVDLAKIAPDGIMAGKVRAYIATNPLYRG